MSPPPVVSITQGISPEDDPTTGVPQSSASQSTLPNCSAQVSVVRDGRTSTSISRVEPGIPALRMPVRSSSSPRPRSAASISPRSGPSPTTRRRNGKPRRRTAASRSRIPFASISRPAKPIVKGSSSACGARGEPTPGTCGARSRSQRWRPSGAASPRRPATAPRRSRCAASTSAGSGGPGTATADRGSRRPARPRGSCRRGPRGPTAARAPRTARAPGRSRRAASGRRSHRRRPRDVEVPLDLPGSAPHAPARTCRRFPRRGSGTKPAGEYSSRHRFGTRQRTSQPSSASRTYSELVVGHHIRMLTTTTLRPVMKGT